jgi:hypothetical protein
MRGAAAIAHAGFIIIIHHPVELFPRIASSYSLCNPGFQSVDNHPTTRNRYSIILHPRIEIRGYHKLSQSFF